MPVQIMDVLDTDKNGVIDEREWIDGLDRALAFKEALEKDLDPETGKLRSYRSVRQQLAKLMGNVQRMEVRAAQVFHTFRQLVP